jgi:small subunit ribosomal protein S9
MDQQANYTAVGKRKTSIARVKIKAGSGTFLVNGKTIENFFSGAGDEIELLKTPILLTKISTPLDIEVLVKGGGIAGQLDAIQLGLSRCLKELKPEFKQILKRKGLLRRDSRIKERRKYGLKKARKASQYSKR